MFVWAKQSQSCVDFEQDKQAARSILLAVVPHTGGGQWANDMWCDAHSTLAIYYTYENWKINKPRAWRGEIALYPIAHPISAPLCIQIIGDTASRRTNTCACFSLSSFIFCPFYSAPAALCERGHQRAPWTHTQAAHFVRRVSASRVLRESLFSPTARPRVVESISTCSLRLK